jgi:hypothetical protein
MRKFCPKKKGDAEKENQVWQGVKRWQSEKE